MIAGESWAAIQVSGKTLERYKGLLAHRARPHLGPRSVQKIRTVDFAELYGILQSPKPNGATLVRRTVGHVHRLMHRVLGHVGVIGNNPVTAASPTYRNRNPCPKPVLDALRGRLSIPSS